MWLWVLAGALGLALVSIGLAVLMLTLRAAREARATLDRCADALCSIAADAKRTAVASEAIRADTAEIAVHTAAIVRVLARLGERGVDAASLLSGPLGQVATVVKNANRVRRVAWRAFRQIRKSAT